MLSKYVWDNIAQETTYLSNAGSKLTDILKQENQLFQIHLVA